MLSRLRTIAKSLLRRWPRAYARARRGYAWLAYRLRIPHETDFKFFAALEGIDGLFVDIGANTGQSARSLRIYNRSLEILSFEPNRLLEPELAFTKRLLGAGLDYRILGLGNEPGRIMLSVPILGRTPQTAWATVDRESLETNRTQVANWLGGHFDIVDLPIDVVRFDSLDLHPTVAKIDVEGFEWDVLKGMDETLRRDEPLLMVEHNEGADEIIGWLVDRGYTIYLYDAAANRLRRTDLPRKTTNYFACTSAWLSRFSGIASLIDDREISKSHATEV
jgi:FkbM family methyltransferase